MERVLTVSKAFLSGHVWLPVVHENAAICKLCSCFKKVDSELRYQEGIHCCSALSLVV